MLWPEARRSPNVGIAGATPTPFCRHPRHRSPGRRVGEAVQETQRPRRSFAAACRPPRSRRSRRPLRRRLRQAPGRARRGRGRAARRGSPWDAACAPAPPQWRAAPPRTRSGRQRRARTAAMFRRRRPHRSVGTPERACAPYPRVRALPAVGPSIPAILAIADTPATAPPQLQPDRAGLFLVAGVDRCCRARSSAAP